MNDEELLGVIGHDVCFCPLVITDSAHLPSYFGHGIRGRPLFLPGRNTY